MTGPLYIEDFDFIPPQGLRDHSYSPTEPESEESIRDEIQGIPDQLRDHINYVQHMLASTDEGDSGADYIGAGAIEGLNENTVAGQLAELKELIDDVPSRSLSDGSVTGAKLADGTITGDKLASGCVSEGKIASGAVSEGKLAAGAVSENKIADGAVTSAKLANGSVTTEKLGDIDGMGHSVVITTSGNWTVPKTGLYRVTLYGGGGGGGAGFYAENSNLSVPRLWIAGGGGSASVPMTRDIYFQSGTVLTISIGAGGQGRTTKNITVTRSGSGSSATYSVTASDADENPGGETSLKLGSSEIMKTSERIPGNACNITATATGYEPSRLYEGQPGSGLAGADEAQSIAVTATLQPRAGKLGGGNGGGYTKITTGGSAKNHGGNATWYGCGGGGGGAIYQNTSAINRGGNGMAGVAIIEYM